MKKGDKYKCVSVSGGGTEYNEGEWIIKTLTDKTLSLQKTSESLVFDTYDRDYIIRCGRIRSNGNVLKDFNDGTFTIYPNQCGTPYYFEPIMSIPESLF